MNKTDMLVKRIKEFSDKEKRDLAWSLLDKKTKAPAKEITNEIVNKMRENGVLLSRSGIHNNTLKIRPSMQFSKKNTDLLISTLDNVLKKINI